MTRDEIIQLATQAGILEEVELLDSNPWRQDTVRELETFANLIAAMEREACAKLVEEWDSDMIAPRDCAAAIRARSGS
jgi:hypothetical protein